MFNNHKIEIGTTYYYCGNLLLLWQRIAMHQSEIGRII